MGPDRDLLIAGGGPVGATLALALAGRGLDIELLEARREVGSSTDDRTLAVSYGTRMIFERIGVWDALPRATPIEAIHVSQRGGFGRSLIEAGNFGLPALGYVLRYADLQRALGNAVHARTGLQVTTGAQVEDIDTSAGTVRLRVRQDDGMRTANARLLVIADGGTRLAGQAGARLRNRDYAQHAVVGVVQASLPHAGRAFERFTGPQIRKFASRQPDGYARTGRIHLVSSFLASLLIGRHAPLDPGDASGMNLMDIAACQWAPRALEATAPDLLAKLPGIVPSSAVIGQLAPYWVQRYGLAPAKVIAWTGDNPSSLIGTGLVREGHIAVSLGTSDTLFGVMDAPTADPSGSGHVFGAPTGRYMAITVFRNGSLARERVRDEFGLGWDGFSRALRETGPDAGHGLMLPWFEPEITPPVHAAGVRRDGLDARDARANVRAVIEGQMMAMAMHSRWMNVAIDTISATGGAAANREILQVMADVFDAPVHQLVVGNSACLGAALRACHGALAAAGRPVPWSDVIDGFVTPQPDGPIRPVAGHVRIYKELKKRYEAFERHCRT